MARSDWPIAKRLVMPEDERLLDLRGVQALFRARRERDIATIDVPDPFEPLLYKHVEALCGAAPSDTSGTGGRERWLESRERDCEAQLRTLEAALAVTRDEVAQRLTSLPFEAVTWGAVDQVAV